jgi:hypothetical protein
MMPPTMPDPIGAKLCRRCGVRPAAGESCAECAARPSAYTTLDGWWNRPNRELHDHEDDHHAASVGAAYRALDDDWTSHIYPEGEGYPDDRAGLSRVSAAMRRQERLDTLIAPICGMAMVALLLMLLWSWVVLGRAALATSGLYPAPERAVRGGAR